MVLLMQLKQTALMYAVMYGGDEEIFVLLIEHGADVMIKNCVSFICEIVI